MAHAAPGLLPGEVAPHPTPVQYVIVAVVLVVITAVEIAVSYLEGDIPDGLIVVLLLGMAVVKFFLVASWYMHLRTDQPVFRRFFILGAIAAVGPLLRRAGHPPRRSCRSERRADAARGRLPELDAPPRRLADRRAARRRVRDRRSSASARAGRSRARRSSRGSRSRAGRSACSRCGSRPTGRSTTSPSVTTTASTWCSTSRSRWWRRRCCCSALPRGCCGGCCARPGCFSTVRTLSRFVPALLVFNLVLVFTHWPFDGEREPALRVRALRACTRCCSCRRSSCGCRS